MATPSWLLMTHACQGTHKNTAGEFPKTIVVLSLNIDQRSYKKDRNPEHSREFNYLTCLLSQSVELSSMDKIPKVRRSQACVLMWKQAKPRRIMKTTLQLSVHVLLYSRRALKATTASSISEAE